MGKSNVLFIIPPILPIDELKEAGPARRWATNCAIPLGVLSIVSYAKKHIDFKVDILDFNIGMINDQERLIGSGWDRFLSEYLSAALNKCKYDVVGISAIFNSNAGYLQPISSTVKAHYPGALILAGGGFPTNLYHYVLKTSPDIDAVAIGESERPFLKLLQANDRRVHLEEADGWMTRNRVMRGMAPTMSLLDKLDDIPVLEYDLLDFEQYQKLNRYHGARNLGDVSVSVMTSRGCPFLCNFCASHSVHGRKMRYHSIERVLEDLRVLKDKYGVTIVLIEDDAFLINKKRAISILLGLKNENITFEFCSGLSIMDIDADVADTLKLCDLKMATLAVESGSERVLKDIINKPYSSLAKVRRAVSLLRERGIYIRAFFVIGFPGETKEEIMSSVRFMKETGFNWIAIMIATPIVGSRLYELCLKNNLLITDKLEHLHYGRCNIRLDHSSPEEIDELRYRINLDVNFVDNYDLKNGHPELALIGFQDVILRFPDHAFAYFFASKCCKELDNKDLANEYLDKYYSVIGGSGYWANYASRFGLPINKNGTT